MRELAPTIPGAPDAVRDARRGACQQPLAVGDVCRLRPHDAEGVAPFVPRDAHRHHLEGLVLDIAQGGMAGVDQHEPQLLDPHARGVRECEAIGQRGTTRVSGWYPLGIRDVG
jgi:hypothetical protein